jgi:hypothetical protein
MEKRVSRLRVLQIHPLEKVFLLAEKVETDKE